MASAIPHRTLVARAVRIAAFAVIGLFLLTVALSVVSCTRPVCWQNPTCDDGRN